MFISVWNQRTVKSMESKNSQVNGCQGWISQYTKPKTWHSWGSPGHEKCSISLLCSCYLAEGTQVVSPVYSIWSIARHLSQSVSTFKILYLDKSLCFSNVSLHRESRLLFQKKETWALLTVQPLIKITGEEMKQVKDKMKPNFVCSCTEQSRPKQLNWSPREVLLFRDYSGVRCCSPFLSSSLWQLKRRSISQSNLSSLHKQSKHVIKLMDNSRGKHLKQTKWQVIWKSYVVVVPHS